MKDPIVEKTKELAEMVCSTEAYRDYHRCLDEIRDREELYRDLNLFRRRSLTVSFLEDPEERAEKMNSLYREYEQVLGDLLSMNFLANEQKVCRMMQRIYDTIAGNVDLDLSHMDLEDPEADPGPER